MDFYLTSEEMLLCRDNGAASKKASRALWRATNPCDLIYDPLPETSFPKEREKRERNSSRVVVVFFLSEESKYEVWLNINTRWMKYRRLLRNEIDCISDWTRFEKYCTRILLGSFYLSVGEPWIEFNVLDRKFFFFLSNGMIKLLEQKRKKKKRKRF